ncbi:1-deoxy-D-xylulose 5-phosphate reductoisomerase [Candidatus Magnetomoraceae bacterium gMMP-1]
MKMKNISILGSTGSIGRNTLEIVNRFPNRFSVKALAAGKNIDLLAAQIEQFKPDIAAVLDKERADHLCKNLKSKINIVYGAEGYKAVASYSKSNMVVSAIVGAAGLLPTLAAIDAGKDIALANKETLVMAGEIVMKQVKEKNISLLPVDSEHSAIFQCLSGQRRQDVDKIIITASGGPFLNTPKNTFESIKPQDALKHPNWQMGQKISIDSATLMNKGLEVIEAKWLFGTETKIEVVIHPQSIIHSMVAYKDGSVIAQLGIPDMKGAIAYALSYPERLSPVQELPDFTSIGTLNFHEPDLDKFPCLKLAFEALKERGTYPAVLNAANEAAVHAFLEEKIAFSDIPKLIQKVMEKHEAVQHPELSDILEADAWARNQLEQL